MFEVRQIHLSGEVVMSSHEDMDHAFDECCHHWAARLPGMPAYAVRDTETDQRWSYADIKDMRSDRD